MTARPTDEYGNVLYEDTVKRYEAIVAAYDLASDLGVPQVAVDLLADLVTDVRTLRRYVAELKLELDVIHDAGDRKALAHHNAIVSSYPPPRSEV